MQTDGDAEKLWAGQLPHSDSVSLCNRAREDVSRSRKSNEVRQDQKTEDKRAKKQEKEKK